MLESTADILRAAGGALIVAAAFFICGFILLRKVMPKLQKKCEGSHQAFCILLGGFRNPLSFWFRVSGLLCVLLAFIQMFPEELLPALLARLFLALPPVLIKLLRLLTVVVVAWGMVASSEITSLALKGARSKLDLTMGKSVARFLSAIFNVLIIAVAAVIVLSELNYDINGLVAGLGLGGLTIALAAQDSASNFFGGLIIVVEKPFEIGDWITCSEVEGTVEDITLRSTKVRTGVGALTIVPNAKLSDSALTNWTATMKRRKASFSLQFLYSTPQADLITFMDALRTALAADEEILPDGILVRFSSLDDSALVVSVAFNTALPGYADHMRIKERVNLKVMELASAHGLTFAYPTQTVEIADARPE